MVDRATGPTRHVANRPRRPGARRLVLATILAIAGVLAAPALADRPAPLPGTLAVGGPVGRPVASGFLGLSIEYSSTIPYAGSDPEAIDPVFLQLVRNLTPGQRPVLRFGGDSTDWSWWPVPGVKKPPGVKITLGPSLTRMLHSLAADLHARIIPGIDLEADSRAVAGTEASKLLAGIGRAYVEGFELGNEPEVYGALGWYARNGKPVPGRPSSYDPAAYLNDFGRIAQALPRGVPVVGPATGAPRYQAAVPQFLVRERDVGMVTLHRYPLARCHPGSAAQVPSISHLLAPSSSDGLAASVAATAALAHAHHIPLRIDELNSVSCGGQLGVSNTMAAALWSLDTLFAFARAGVDGVNIHTFHHAWYGPFDVAASAGTWHGTVTPMYYGMLMFAEAAPPGSRLLAVGRPAVASERVWATRDTHGVERVVFINEAAHASGWIAVPSPHHAAAGMLSRLSAPSLTATGGLTLGAQQIPAGTTTGRLTGTPSTPALAADDGRFLVSLPPASATLLTIPAR